MLDTYMSLIYRRIVLKPQETLDCSEIIVSSNIKSYLIYLIFSLSGHIAAAFTEINDQVFKYKPRKHYWVSPKELVNSQ